MMYFSTEIDRPSDFNGIMKDSHSQKVFTRLRIKVGDFL